ncbi:hypothetical protein ACFPIJ_43950 [Dactylosporangium cerinum]|uniref:Chaperone DnaJ C-terminal domain-containing protein n=1 Tax=Dactylosporangium cerinum TaxID=1434730 RepID=A0ABV9W9R1_9ACTN
MHVRAGTQPDARVRLRDHGRPADTGDRGDLIVQFEVPVPAMLDTESERLLRRFARLRKEVAALTSSQPGAFDRVGDAFDSSD